jgi:hypothetical protein
MSYREIYDSLLIVFNEYNFTTDLKKISDAYKKEFIMFLSICKLNNFNYSYPFYEFDRIIDIVIHNIELFDKIKKILDQNDSLTFNKNICINLQEMIIICMKYNFNYDIIGCNTIKYVNLKLKFNIYIEEIYILNLNTVNDLKNLIFNKFKLNLVSDKYLEIYKDKICLQDDKKIIEYDVDDDDIINIIINQKS